MKLHSDRYFIIVFIIIFIAATISTTFFFLLFFFLFYIIRDRLCGLVVRVSGYRYRGLGFDSRRYQIF